MKQRIGILLLSLLTLCGFGQTTQFEARLDTNRILIGEQTTFHLQAIGVNDESLVWPVWPDTLQGIEVLSSVIDSIYTETGWTIAQEFVVTSFDSGFVVIPPFVISTGGETLETEPQILNVSTVSLDPEQDFYDIKEPIEPPIDWIYWLKRLWFVLVIVALVLALVLWLWLRKRKEKKAIEEIPDTRTPAQRAKDTLHAIREQRIWQDGKVKRYYSEVTDAVRTYLEESYPVPAMEMISDELLEAMQTRISAQAQQLLRKALQQADMVKFAKAKPGPDQHAQIWEDALRIIELTEPKTAEHDS